MALGMQEVLHTQPASPPHSSQARLVSGKQQEIFSQELVFSQELGFQPGVVIC